MKLANLAKFCFCIVVGIFIGYLLFHNSSNPSIPFDPTYKEDVIKKDSIIRDSISKKNDSIDTEIEHIEKEYDKEISNILSNSDSINLCFFSEYVEHYNNERSAKNNKSDIFRTQEVKANSSVVRDENN